MAGAVAWVSREWTPRLFGVAVGVICNLEQIFQLCSSQFARISEVTLHIREKHYVQIGRRVTLVMVVTYR